MVEIWKNIEGYEGLYQVSNFGRVKSLGNDKSRKERILKQAKTNVGYITVGLCKDGKQINKKVHRLVAGAFIPNPLNLAEVNHKDENKTNNCVDNLEWCDRKYNANYGTRIKRVAEKRSKKVICVETGKVYPSTREAQRQTGINFKNISSCCNGKRKTTGGFNWRYIN